MASRLQIWFILSTFLALVPLFVSSQATSNVVSATFIGSPIPTSIPGDNTYTLLGCYVEPPSSSGHRALGPPGTYITPAGLDTNSLTVKQCLQACATTLDSTGVDAYSYAGLENSNECYCSPVLLINETHVVSSGFCTSPCTGDSTTSCGGYGYIDIYQITSNIISNSSSSSSLTATTSQPSTLPSSNLPPSSSSTSRAAVSATISPTSTAAVSKSSKSSFSGGAIAGTVIGSIAGVLLLLILIFWLRRRPKKKAAEKYHPTTQAVSIVDSPGFINPNPRRNGIIYPSDSASPKPWEVRDPRLTPNPSEIASTNQPRGLDFFRDGSQRRPAFEHWKSGGPSELEGNAEHSAVGTFNNEDLLEGFNETGGRQKVMSWKAGDDETLKRDESSGSQSFPYVGQDRVELPTAQKDGIESLGRTNSSKGVELVESPVLGRPEPDVGSVAGGREEEGSSLTTTATGGWSPREMLARSKRTGNQYGLQEKLG